MANPFGEGFLQGQQIRRNRESARERFRQRELQKQADAFMQNISDQIQAIHEKYAIPQQELNNLMREEYLKPVKEAAGRGEERKQLRARKRLLQEELVNAKMLVLGPARMSPLPGVGEAVGTAIRARVC
jgi:hypothetical protein